MVGLVIVSHSRALGNAVVDFIKQTNDKDIPVVAAGGVGEQNELLGTDAHDIMDAINAVYSKDGVLVLMDLGSAILSTELAIDFLEEDKQNDVRICSAPIVEGAVVAAVQIAIGSSLNDVASEALEGLITKQEHLDETHNAALKFDKESLNNTKADTLQRVFTIRNALGLHARPAMKLVQLIGKYDASAEVSNISKGRGPVEGRSLNKLSSLNVHKDDQLLFEVSGKDGDRLLNAIEIIVQDNFGEPMIPTATVPVQRKRPDGAVGVSDGIAIGKAFHLKKKEFKIEKREIIDVAAEKEKLREAVRLVDGEISQRINNLSTRVSDDEIEIFEAHKVLLTDPELYDDTLKDIGKDKISAEYAWNSNIQKVKDQYTSLDNEYLQLRGNDVQDVGTQVTAALLGQSPLNSTDFQDVGSDEQLILVAEDLTPSETAMLDFHRVKGIVIKYGGPTSHTAILSRAMGIPAVCGYSSVNNITNGELLIMNGSNGEINTKPSEQDIDRATKQIAQWQEHLDALRKKSIMPAVTVDGFTFNINANISSGKEALSALNSGAEGIGLLRTEFMFLNKQSAPSEDEQYEELVNIGEVMKGKPVVVRTLDIGGDKMIPYISMNKEDNPFLGVRGIRLYEKNTELMTIHFSAILRAALDYDFRIMFPMIAEANEFIRISKTIADLHYQLEKKKIKHKWPIPMGAMIETPSAVVMAEVLARHADFFSIGSNDLTQYIMAAERGNSSLINFSDPLNPAVLRSIHMAIQEAHKNGIEISVCGEIGSDPHGIAVLIGMGIDKISLNSGKIPEIKALIRKLDKKKIADILPDLFLKENVADVREDVAQLLKESES